MNFNYVQIDKNPRQRKIVKLGAISMDCRIEWNNRSRCWYLLIYIGDQIVLRNTKIQFGEAYRLEGEYPYLITMDGLDRSTWNSLTILAIANDPYKTADVSLVEDIGLFTRSTSTFTHSKNVIGSEYDDYLFD